MDISSQKIFKDAGESPFFWKFLDVCREDMLIHLPFDISAGKNAHANVCLDFLAWDSAGLPVSCNTSFADRSFQ